MKKGTSKPESGEKSQKARSLEPRRSVEEPDAWRSLLGDWPFAGRLARPWDELLQASPWASRARS
jgi:hypothetical protein